MKTRKTGNRFNGRNKNITSAQSILTMWPGLKLRCSPDQGNSQSGALERPIVTSDRRHAGRKEFSPSFARSDRSRHAVWWAEHHQKQIFDIRGPLSGRMGKWRSISSLGTYGATLQIMQRLTMPEGEYLKKRSSPKANWTRGCKPRAQKEQK